MLYFGALPAISRDNPHIATKYMSWASVQEEQVFKELTREVTAAGLMKPRIAPYANLAAILTALFCTAAYFAVQGKVVAAALTIALFWQQVRQAEAQLALKSSRHQVISESAHTIES